MQSLRTYLRSLVKANGSEVVLPWFPEARASTPALRLVRRSRREPAGSVWITVPLAILIWFPLSLWTCWKMCREKGPIARDSFNIGQARQFLQMWQLAWCKNVSPLDYHECHFYLKEARKHAVYYLPPTRHGRLTADLNAGRPSETLDHKLQGYRSLKAAGLPTVDIIEIFKPDGSREFGRNDQDLAGYIGMHLFVKPVNGFGGRLTERWTHDAVQQEYSNGTVTIPEQELWTFLSQQAAEMGRDQPDKNARLVQRLLVNHNKLKPLSQEALNTLRVCTLHFPGGPVELFYAELRMALGDSVSDTGPCGFAGVIDLKTGLMRSGVTMTQFACRIPVHPDTGAQVEGFQFPLWDKVQELCLRAHGHFPENPIVGWDIAVTPDGPLIVEANCNPYMNVPQVTLDEPIALSRFCDLFWSWMQD